jgi:acetyl-CoA carboxylase carboxyltransferase component
MVGPAAERTATVRHFARMFVTGANLEVPIGTIVLRKGYGLGAQAMAGGGFKAGLFCVGWPTSEFGGMGLEGAVRLGMRRELEAIEDPAERERVFEATVAAAYERGQGISMAAYGEIDDVIDPADSRRWIETLFGERPPRQGKRRPNIDAW